MQSNQHLEMVTGITFKYLWRYEHKHSNNPLEDLEKAQWYLKELIKNFKKKK